MKTILLVEDSDIVREMTKLTLEDAGYQVRTAVGNTDLESQIANTPGFLDGLSLIVLDMELAEDQQRQREDKDGSHVGVYMTGSQIGVGLALAHPQLQEVPFLVYSGHEPAEIQAHLDELKEFAEYDDRIKNNFKGFVSKHEGAAAGLLEKINLALAD